MSSTQTSTQQVLPTPTGEAEPQAGPRTGSYGWQMFFYELVRPLLSIVTFFTPVGYTSMFAGMIGAVRGTLTASAASLPPPETDQSSELILELVKDDARERIQRVLSGESDELVLSIEDTTGPISVELGLLIRRIIRTEGVKLRRLIARGCGLSGTPFVELRSMNSEREPVKIEKVTFVSALSKLWYIHEYITSVSVFQDNGV